MKKIITFLALFLLPLSAQAMALTSSEDVRVSATDSGSGIHADINASSDTETGHDGKITPTPTLFNMTAQRESNTETAKASSTARMHSESVKTETDLAQFSDDIASANENVASVDTASDNEVAVEYAHPAKLFGVIPVHITSRTSARLASDGTPVVETTFPWWKFFVTGVEKTNDKVDSAIKATAATYLTASTTAHQKALLAESIVATLNADAGVSLLGK